MTDKDILVDVRDGSVEVHERGIGSEFESRTVWRGVDGAIQKMGEWTRPAFMVVNEAQPQEQETAAQEPAKRPSLWARIAKLVGAN